METGRKAEVGNKGQIRKYGELRKDIDGRYSGRIITRIAGGGSREVGWSSSKARETKGRTWVDARGTQGSEKNKGKK